MPTSLLDLPAEIVQRVLHLLDPSSFYVCLLTSKLVRDHALQSKKTLLHQLDQIPGVRDTLLFEDQDAPALLSEFSKRAVQHLSNGVSRMANIHTFRAAPTIDRSLSKITAFYDMKNIILQGPIRERLILMLQVHPSIGTIEICGLKGEVGPWRVDGDPRLLHVVSTQDLLKLPPTFGQQRPKGYRIVAIAWKGAISFVDSFPHALLAILLEPVPQAGTDLTLVIMDMDPNFGPKVAGKYNIDPPSDTSVVAAFSFTIEGSLWIAWRLYDYTYKVSEYNITTDFSDLVESGEFGLDPFITYPDHIADIQSQGGRVSIYPSVTQMPAWTGSISDIVREDTYVPETTGVFESAVRGIPLKDYHHHKIVDAELNHGAPTCVHAFLKLVISRPRHHPGLFSERHGVFILKAIKYQLRCEAQPALPSRALEHICVARLANVPPLDNLPTLGLKVAITPGSFRIALAAWRTLRIYSIEPMAFFKPTYGNDTHAEEYPGDYAYVNACGWEYYRNNPVREGSCVVLEPVEMESKGVIYALQWRTENELWAITTEGVCKWELGVRANGHRMESELGDGDKGLGLTKRKRDPLQS